MLRNIWLIFFVIPAWASITYLATAPSWKAGILFIPIYLMYIYFGLKEMLTVYLKYREIRYK